MKVQQVYPETKHVHVTINAYLDGLINIITYMYNISIERESIPTHPCEVYTRNLILPS